MFTNKPQDWVKKAACRGYDTNLFFPERGGQKEADKAKAICADCPVINPCRDYALELAQLFDTQGIFGGTSYKQRAIMLRKQNLSTRRLGVAW